MRAFRTGPLVLGMLLAVIGILGLSRPARAGDPWYFDVDGHWSRSYVRVMWEEGVTDGWLLLDGTLAMFQPGRAMTRVEYIMLLAKAFRLAPIT